MKNWFGLTIVFLAILCMFSPVSAWHADVTLSGPKGTQCATCDFYIYTMSANSLIWPEYILRVNDTLPAGLEYIEGSSSTEPGGNVVPQWDASTRTLTWDFYKVKQPNPFRNITFKVKPTGLTSVNNTAETWVMPHNNNLWEAVAGRDSNTVTTTFSDTVCPVPTPEFPTIALPAALMAGLLGVILIIKKTKEN